MSSLVLIPTDGSSLELIGGSIGMVAADGLTLPVVPYEEIFASGPDTEGGPLVKSSAGNATATINMWLLGDNAAEYWANVRTWQEAVEACRRKGGTLTFVPNGGGSEVTYDIASARITEMPQLRRHHENYVAGSTAEFICRPYARLPEQPHNLSIVDDFSFNTLGNQDWLLDAGVGTVSVSGGQLVPSSTAIKNLRRQSIWTADRTTTVKVIPGASVATDWAVYHIKYLDTNNYLLGGITRGGFGDFFLIQKVVAGTGTTLSFNTPVMPTPNVPFWIQFKVIGNVTTLTHYLSDPNGSTPTSAINTLTYTLTGAEATQFGASVTAATQLYFQPKGTDWRLDEWRQDAPWIESTTPLVDFYALDVPGSAPALGDLTVLERVGQLRHYLDWGRAKADDRTPVVIDSASFSVSGWTGTANTRAGSYDPDAAGNNVVRSAALTTGPLGVFGVGVGVPRGTKRVKTRIWAPGGGNQIYLRAVYNGPVSDWRYLPWVAVPIGINNWLEIDLGVIHFPDDNDQQSNIGVSQYAPVSTSTVDYDYLSVYPAEDYGEAVQTVFPYALIASSNARIKHDVVTTTGGARQPGYVGPYLRLDPGDHHFALKARRGNINIDVADSSISDSIRLSLSVTPRVAIL